MCACLSCGTLGAKSNYTDILMLQRNGRIPVKGKSGSDRGSRGSDVGVRDRNELDPGKLTIDFG